MERHVWEALHKIAQLLEVNLTARQDLEKRLIKVERQLDAFEDAVVDSLCTMADQVAGLEGVHHG